MNRCLFQKRNPCLSKSQLFRFSRTLLAACLGFLTLHQHAAAESFCLDFRYYPNQENLARYDFSILDLQSQPDMTAAHAAGKKLFSYLSVGQIAGNAPYLSDVQARHISFLGKNTEWNSYYVDLSDPRWADYVIDVLARSIVDKGFDGFFLDTVDAVETAMDWDPARAQSHRAGMVNLIRSLKEAYPSKQIILNRGFAVFPEVKSYIKGMLVEELFERDDYTSRSPGEVDELLARIAPVTAAGLPVYIVDYVPRYNLGLARATAERIAGLGFNPAVIPQEIDGTVLAPDPPSPSDPPPPPPPDPVDPPVIVTQPSAHTALSGHNVTLGVSVSGEGPFSYEWRFNGTAIDGANEASLALKKVTPSDAGDYAVMVSNAGGSVASATAHLTVILQTISLKAAKRPDGDLELSFRAIAGQSYTVQFSSEPNGPNWSRLLDVQPNPSDQTVTFTDRVATRGGCRYYRVISPAQP